MTWCSQKIILQKIQHLTSRSLLGQLGMKDTLMFWDSARPDKPHNLVKYSGLTNLLLAEGIVRHLPKLDEDDASERHVQLSFNDWWNKYVFRIGEGEELSRRHIVQAMANHDGGAHVDPTLEEKYAALSRANALGRTFLAGGNSSPVVDVERAAVRQIAHEVLKTLIPGYTQTYADLSLPDGAVLGSLEVEINYTPRGTNTPTVAVAARNAPCPCGSGRKYKKCHGRPQVS